jgi:hypothetical protein
LFLKGKDSYSPFTSLNIAAKRAAAVYDFVKKHKLSIYYIDIPPKKVNLSTSFPLEFKPFINYILNRYRPCYEK